MLAATTRSDLEERAIGTEVGDLGLADQRPLAPALVDVAADRERRTDALDGGRQRGAAEVVARADSRRSGRAAASGAPGSPVRAALERRGRLLVRQVEAPVPRGDRDPGAQAEERAALELRASRRAARSRRTRPTPRHAARRRSRCCQGRGPSACRSRPARRSSPRAPRESTRSRRRRSRRRRSALRSTRLRARPRSRCRSLKARIRIALILWMAARRRGPRAPGAGRPLAIRARSAAATSSKYEVQRPWSADRGVSGRAAREAATTARNARASAGVHIEDSTDLFVATGEAAVAIARKR